MPGERKRNNRDAPDDAGSAPQPAGIVGGQPPNRAQQQPYPYYPDAPSMPYQPGYPPYPYGTSPPGPGHPAGYGQVGVVNPYQPMYPHHEVPRGSAQAHDGLGKRRDSVALPSMTSWAPPPPQAEPAVAEANPPYWSPRLRHFATNSNQLPSPGQLHHPSMPNRSPNPAAGPGFFPPGHTDEHEAGLALAGMGLNRDSPKGGRVKKEAADDESSLGKERTVSAKKKIKLDPPVEESDGSKPVVAKKSCAECRRLKAKCDRVFPCSNCRRRGCALVCPDGDLSCMQGKRLVLASTEHLHDRIAQLEAALTLSYKQHAAGTHPLLTADHLDGGTLSDNPPLASPRPIAGTGDESSARASSTNKSPVGSPHHIATPLRGRMAVESLLINERNTGPEGKKEDEWVGENAAPAMIVGTVGSAPHESASDRQATLSRLRAILQILPDRDAVRAQADRFWAQSTWYQNILRREEFQGIYEPSVFEPTPANPLTPHKLACVLMVLTLDTYFDLEGDKDSPLVGDYWEGVQQCFDTRFGWAASVAGVQALALATLFVGFGWRGVGASNFYWLRMMTSAAQQLGLHKEPHPSLSPSEQNFRRRVFHEMYSLDCLISINHGQRTAIPIENIEAKHPNDNLPLMRLKYVYMEKVKNEVIMIGCRPDVVEGETEEERELQVGKVLEVLQKYDPAPDNEHHLPILHGVPLPDGPPDPTKLDVMGMTRSTTSMCHFKALMFLFRPSLRRLIARLRRSPPSDISDADRRCIRETYRACTSIIAVSGYVARTHPRLAARLWVVWVQTFSAAVSLAALAIWCGSFMDHGFVEDSYREMKGGCDMIIGNGSERAKGVMSLLPILCSLVENKYPHLSGPNQTGNPAVQQGEDMLFLLLGGQVDYKPPSAPTPTIDPSTLAPRAAQPPSRSAARIISSASSDAPSVASQSIETPPLVFPHQSTQPMPNPLLQGLPQTWGTTSIAPITNPINAHAGAGGANVMIGGQWTPNNAATPFAVFDPVEPDSQQTSGQGQGQSSIHGQGLGHDGAFGGMEGFGLDAAEIWARLQTFYEPAPAFWQGPGLGYDMGAAAGGVPIMAGAGGQGGWGWQGDAFGNI